MPGLGRERGIGMGAASGPPSRSNRLCESSRDCSSCHIVEFGLLVAVMRVSAPDSLLSLGDSVDLGASAASEWPAVRIRLYLRRVGEGASSSRAGAAA
jgi:hypothetical protein